MAYRAPVHEYLDAGVNLTPEQFATPTALITGFPSLFTAVLEEAWRSALGASTLNAGGASLKVHRRRSRQHTELRRVAREWFFSDDIWAPFSFLAVCDYLDLDSTLIRIVLTRAIDAQADAEERTGEPQPLLSRGTRGKRRGKSVIDQWTDPVPLAARGIA
jgi:hypothetical protein